MVLKTRIDVEYPLWIDKLNTLYIMLKHDNKDLSYIVENKSTHPNTFYIMYYCEMKCNYLKGLIKKIIIKVK